LKTLTAQLVRPVEAPSTKATVGVPEISSPVAVADDPKSLPVWFHESARLWKTEIPPPDHVAVWTLVAASRTLRSASFTVIVTVPEGAMYDLSTETVPVTDPKTGMIATAVNSNATIIPMIEYLDNFTFYPLSGAWCVLAEQDGSDALLYKMIIEIHLVN